MKGVKKSFKDYLSAEQREHTRLVEYLNWDGSTKNTLFWHTMSEGKRTPFERFLWQVMGAKKGVPDFIFATRRKGFCGMAIELKASGTLVYKKNGECYFPEQETFLKRLEQEGWKAQFCVGFDEAIKIIKDYFGE